MSTNSFLVFTGIAPHPPIMVPEVGGDVINEVRGSIDAMAEFSQRVIASGAETVVLISPHAPLEHDSFVVYDGSNITGHFARFRAPQTKFTVPVDTGLLSALNQQVSAENFELSRIKGTDLDHGIAVPLYFLLLNGWQGAVVALGYSFLPKEDHLRFGSCLKRAIDSVGRRVALVASGDLSHRLKPDAPAGYNPFAHKFDDAVVEAIRANNLMKIELIDDYQRKVAGECGYRSMLIAIGAMKEIMPQCEVINYEAPFGVGYMVAQLSADSDVLAELPTLARQSVELRVCTGLEKKPPARPFGILAERAGCFVSIKTKDGELRGCIGTIEPSRDTLAEEIIANALSAASNDPRFEPVNGNELSTLVYSVDVLSLAEPTTFEKLDPKVYGVIVDDGKGRRGLLLPDIQGITDAKQQVEIATRKAGISKGKPVKLLRFEVRRFRE